MATETATTTATQLTGCVKWFDNGLNYGFITVLSEGEHHNADIFVHQSNIQTKRDCYRTLYTGECVQFTLAKSDNEKHPYHAMNVIGYNGTMLHCENPNYRPRDGFRGGRGRGRGGARNGTFRPRTEQSGNVPETTTTPVADTTPVVDTTPVEAPAVENSPARRGRGRGRGKVNV